MVPNLSFGDVRTIAKNLRYPEQWITRSGCAIIVLAVSIATFGISNNIFEITKPYSLLWAVVAAPASFAIWFLARYLYWNSGKGRKIGIFYQGYRVSLYDWVWTRSRLCALLEDERVSQAVTIRLLPPRFARNDAAKKKIKSKYGFTILLDVVASPSRKNSGSIHYRMAINASSKAKWSNAFALATAAHSLAILRLYDSKSKKSVTEVLDERANSLFDLICLLLGVIDTAEEEFSRADAFLETVETSLANRLNEGQNPRRAIRWLHSRVMLAPANFDSTKIPPPEELALALKAVSRANDRYGAQFKDVHYALARMKFFNNDIEGAIQSSQLVYDSCGTDKALKAHATLSLAVLHLCMSNFGVSRKFFSEFFDSDAPKTQNWEDLVAFADLARETCSEHAVFVQALYRKQKGDPLSAELESDVTKWMDADPSRSGLRALYRRCEKGKKSGRKQASGVRPKKGRGGKR